MQIFCYHRSVFTMWVFQLELLYYDGLCGSPCHYFLLQITMQWLSCAWKKQMLQITLPSLIFLWKNADYRFTQPSLICCEQNADCPASIDMLWPMDFLPCHHWYDVTDIKIAMLALICCEWMQINLLSVLCCERMPVTLPSLMCF